MRERMGGLHEGSVMKTADNMSLNTYLVLEQGAETKGCVGDKARGCRNDTLAYLSHPMRVKSTHRY